MKQCTIQPYWKIAIIILIVGCGEDVKSSNKTVLDAQISSDEAMKLIRNTSTPFTERIKLTAHISRSDLLLEAYTELLRSAKTEGEVRQSMAGIALTNMGVSGHNAYWKGLISYLSSALRNEEMFSRMQVALGDNDPVAQQTIVISAFISHLKNRNAQTDTSGDDEFYGREYGAIALGDLGKADPAVIRALALALKDSDFDVKLRSAWALGDIGPEASDAVPALIEALGDPGWHIRNCVANSLGRIGPSAKAAVPALESQSRESNKRVVCSVHLALARITRDVGPQVRALIGLLEHDDSPVRYDAIRSLGAIGPAAHEAIPVLRKIMASDGNGKDAKEALANILGASKTN